MRKNVSLPALRAVLMVLLIAFGVGEMWAGGGGSSNYYASLKITKSGPTGAGSVYVANSNSKPGSDNAGTAVKSAATTSSGGNVTMYWWVDINPGYNVSLSGKVSGGPYSAASASGNVSCAASTTKDGTQAYTATATFVAVTVNSVSPTSVALDPTNPSTDYPFTVTFATSNLKTIAIDLTKSPETTDGKFTITNWSLDGSNVVATGKFNGGGSYGGASRNNSTTVSLQSKASGSAAKTCTVTANFPAMAFVSVEADDVYATQGESGKTGSATFKYNYAAEDDFPTTPTLTPTSGTGAFTVTGYTVTPDFAKGETTVTVNYSFDTNNGIGETPATLTLTAVNGDVHTVTVTGHSEALATNDASVTPVGGSPTEYATFAQALAAANGLTGSTLTLLRNVDLGTITATNNINKAMTIDLNGKELRAAVNATDVGILTIAKAVAVTIKDSKTGGKIINEIARNSAIRTIFVNKAGATLTLESGTIAVNNLGQYASAANSTLGVAKYANCTARAIHQIAGTTVNINGGRVEAIGTREVYGIVQASSAATNAAGTSVLNITGGEIYAEAPYSAYGICAYGKVNMSAGVINTHINTNMVNAYYAADNANNTSNGNGYGIYMQVSVSATASSCYYGTLNMTGGTVNVISDRTKAASLYNYGIHLNAAATGVGAGKTATDGTLSQKACAKASIENATINVHSGTYYSYGINVLGSYNSYDNTYFTVPIKNSTIDVKAYTYTYGVVANCGINSTYGGKYWGDVELTGNTLTAESVTGSTAYGVYVVATTAHIFKDANTTTAPIYFGEYATAAKAVINSGTYTAKTKTSSAYAVCSSTRAKTIYDPETTVQTNRKPSGAAEAYPIIIIHGGTFRGETTTSTSRAVSSGGYTTIDGGTFEAFSTTTTAYGLYAVSGKLTASGVTISANATQYAYGALADCAVPSGNTAQTGFAYAAEMELNNCDITATTRTSTEARGVFANATNKMHTWAGLKADSTSNKWATTTYNAYKSVFPCTVAGHDSVGIAIAAKATINGCDIKATAATTTAYGVYSTATSVPASADSVASPVVNIKNTKFTVKTNGTTSAYGMYAGGPTTIDGCDFTVLPKTTTAYGVYIYDKKTTITNTKFDVKGTTTAYGIYANAALGSTTGWDYHGEVELGEGNDMTVAATAGNTSHVLTLIAAKKNVASGRFAGDYANAASALITGGKYKATATGTTSYVLNLSDQQVQGDVISRPTCTIEDGKFWALASSGTTGICTANGQIGHIVFKGGFYNVNTNLAKYKEQGKNVIDVLSGTPEYTEGYRYKVTSDLSGATVCKVYQGNTEKAAYATLEEALQYVNANTGTTLTIVMVADYTLKKGDYLLPANATLVVPKELTQKAAIGTTPSRQNVNTPAPVQFLMLTFDAGVNMTVKGTIETSAVNTAANGGQAITGAPTGNFGRLHMVEGSTMTLESGANLNCWGYTTGKGEINALNGSTVREGFQLGYWRGGTATSSMLSNRNSWHAFPVTDYFIQNVEAPITFRPGAQLLGYSGVNVSIVGIQAANNVKLIGTSASMFLMEEADASEDTYVRKEYDPETDRAIWTVNSGAKIGSFSFSLAGNTVNSADYYLPISNNMTIYVNEGEFTVTQDALLIPGAQVIISKLGKLTVASGKRLFVMDNEDWPGFLKSGTTTVSRWYYNALYSPSWTTNPRTLKYPPTTTRLPDGEIFVHGETEGSYYTSTSGANIHSTNDDAGKVKFVANAGADNSIQHVVNTDNERVTINFTTAQLKNETPETPYTSSKNTVAGEAFVYMEQQWVKVTDGCLTTRTDGSGTHEYAKPSDVVEVVSNGDNAYRDKATNSRYFINAEKALSNAQCVWWEVEPVTSGTYAGDYMANQEKYENYGAYYYWDGSAGYWKPRYVTVTWKNQDGTTLATYTNVMCNTSPKYLSASPTWANTSVEKHDWVGWRDANGNIYDKNAVLPVAQGNVTYTAYYNVSKYEYTITFKNPDNTVIWAGLVEAGTVPECPVEPTQTPTVSTVYTFTGWNTTPVAVTGTATYTAVYSNATRQYHVMFYNYDAQSVLYEANVDYNTRPVYGGVTPFRANTSSFSYEWTGWQQGANTYDTDDDLAIVTGNVNYIATYSQTDLKYQVFFKRQDGSIIDAPFFNYEETPAAFPANPTLASTVSTDYTFDHWDPATLQPVTVDGMVYTAHFSESPRQYTAHFVNYDGTSLGVDQTIDYNTVPAYTGVTPFKPNDSRNSFEFAGWAWEAGADWAAGSIGVGEAFPAIKGDITFTAQFTETLLQFNIIYKREDGTVIEQQKKKWGESTAFPSVSNYEDATHTYTFDHWSPATVVTPVTTDATYTAYFNQAIKTYSISSIGINPTGYGSVSPASVTGIPVGSTVTVNGNKITVNGQTVTATPTAADAQYTYTFDHWNNVPATVTANVTNIEAVFTRSTNTYTVIWKNGDVTLETDEKVAYGATPHFDGETPTKAADAQYTYTFSGWSPAISSVEGNVTYTAQFNETERKYRVTWDANGGACETEYTDFSYNAAIGTLPVATKEGHTFNGWFTSATGGTQITTATKVTADVTYHAQFTVNPYTITFDSNGGSSVASITQNYGTAVTAPADPTREGYTFSGWSPAVPGTMPVNGLTCVAQWTVATYEVALDANGGTGGSTSVTMTYNSVDHTAITNPTRTGYTFHSWNTTASSSTRKQVISSKGVMSENVSGYTGVGGVWIRTTMPTTLYARWSQKSYTTTFTHNGNGSISYNGTVVDAGGTAKVYHVSAKSLVATPNTGYHFTGWTVSGTNASKVTIADLSAASTTIKATAASATVTAGFAPDEYTISYKDQGDAEFSGVHGSGYPTTHTYGTATVLVSPTKEGYTFDGWYDNAECAGTALTEIEATDYTADFTLYAKWTINKYKVTFDSNGGSAVSTIEQNYGTSVTAPADPTREGYTFNGWSPAVPSVMPASNTNCVAQWTINKYKVTFDSNGGSAVSTIEQNYNTAVTAPADPTREGYTFNGWVPAVPSVMPATNTNCVAQWTINQYNLIVATNNNDWGAVTGGGKYDYNSNHEIKATPATGYKFVQWNDGNIDATRNVTIPADDVTYTATFEADIANYTVKHWQQNIYDDNYTEVTDDRQNLSGKVGSATVAVAKTTYTGFTTQAFEQGTIAGDGSTVVNIYYNRNTYTITWVNGDGITIETDEQVKYGATPTYDGATPTKTQTVEWVYTHDGWTPAIEAVTGNATYTATFGQEKRKYNVTWTGTDITERTDLVEYGETPVYGEEPTKEPTVSEVFTFKWMNTSDASIDVQPVTCDVTYAGSFVGSARPYIIRFVNDDGAELQSSEVGYGSTPSYTGTPLSALDASCAFIGWTPAITLVGGETTYTATYRCTVAPIVVEADETESIDVNTETTTTIVRVTGALHVSAKLTTDDLILEATPNSSGEIIGSGNIEATNAYFHFSREGGFKARTWYAVAVPWEVFVPVGGNNGVYTKKGDGDFVKQVLGTTYDLIYYDGKSRAEGKVKAWRYVEDDQNEKNEHHDMRPGCAYMIYLTSDADTIRFKSREGATLHEHTEIMSYPSSIDAALSSWNGIANPATYHAYINAYTTGNKGQVYNAETKGYDLFDMKENKLVVGQPIFIQTTSAGGAVPVNRDAYPNPLSAQRRRAKEQASQTQYELMLAASEADVTDRVIVRLDEDKEKDAYLVGHDLVKMGVSDKVPQMWINRYEKKMCINTIAGFDNTADYPLGIFAPKDGEYDLFIEDQPDNESMLYLTYDGSAIWNLSYGGYVANLNKGTNTHYGLRIVKKAPQIATGFDEAVVDAKGETRKVVVNDQVYIIRGEKVYTIDGQMVK